VKTGRSRDRQPGRQRTDDADAALAQAERHDRSGDQLDPADAAGKREDLRQGSLRR
jgi:hypothetical protein